MKQDSKKAGLAGLVVAALGVVYGDIGTSPLYAVNEIFFSVHAELSRTPENVLGAISLIFWSLTLLVAIVYIALVLEADHYGEGGVFALLGILGGYKTRGYRFIAGLLMLAAGLLYGDGIITPAISVLSAVEGLKVATPAFEPYIVPITIVILTCLFLPQRFGTAKVGIVFGPIIIVWFLSIGTIGGYHLLQTPKILSALNPIHALRFFMNTELHTMFIVLGSVMLAVTGGEALFADMGHFGRKPIRIGWFLLVYPALCLSYFGQGAFLLSGKEILEGNLFFSLVPSVLLYPMVGLATAATIIASQALITGAYSLTNQATALGLLPRFKVVHTSRSHEGQIYLPFVNAILYIGCVALVLFFKTSSNLAAAYGLAVSAVMCVTAISMMSVATHHLGWKSHTAFVVFGVFGVICAMFLIANSLKFWHGGYIPLIIGLVLYGTMSLWKWGRALLAEAFGAFNGKTMEWLAQLRGSLDVVKDALDHKFEPEIAGLLLTGERQLVELNRAVVFLSSRPITSLKDRVPAVIRVFLKKSGALPRHITIFHAKFVNVSDVTHDKYEVYKVATNIISVVVRYGYTELPDVRLALRQLQDQGKIKIPSERWIIEVGEEAILIDGDVRWFKRQLIYLFAWILRISTPAHWYLGLKADAAVSKEVIPVLVGQFGSSVHIPELEVSTEFGDVQVMESAVVA